jgi:hypothetical protein
MLKDELQALRLAITDQPAVSLREVEELCAQVTTAWQGAMLSDICGDSFRRYLNFHLSRIAELSKRITVAGCDITCPAQQGLIKLTEYLVTNYGQYLELETSAPPAYALKVAGAIANRTKDILDKNPGPYGMWVCEYLLQAGNEAHSFRRLAYLHELVDNIPGFLSVENDMLEYLISVNFNHLGFYHFFTGTLTNLPTDSIQKINHKLQAIPVKSTHAFDNSWISLKEMSCGWLIEEIAVRNDSGAKAVTTEKIYLDVSVAQLACFIRLLYDEGLLGKAALTDIFRMICNNFRTKRQLTISEGSFSKEYYGISQQTASRLDGFFQRLRERIRRRYFPALAFLAASVAHHFVAGS